MVVAPPKLVGSDGHDQYRVRPLSIPVVDLSCRRSCTSELIVRACEEMGFFMVINHRVQESLTLRLQAAAQEFFARSAAEKQQLRCPADPYGYGSKAIGRSGDVGDVEYLLLHTQPSSIDQVARSLSMEDPTMFSCIVKEYVDAAKDLACEILELLGEGLGLTDTGAFSRLLMDRENDSLLRLNHYPPSHINEDLITAANKELTVRSDKIGFGEHSDPQIITLLRSNGVAGLQILSCLSGEKVWVPVPSDPTAFCVNVGDILQAMTNGRLISVRHRAMINSGFSRLSIAYFGAPPLSARISPLPEMITPQTPCSYRPFTWDEFKKAMYSLKLGYNRLDLFPSEPSEGEDATLMTMQYCKDNRLPHNSSILQAPIQNYQG